MPQWNTLSAPASGARWVQGPVDRAVGSVVVVGGASAVVVVDDIGIGRGQRTTARVPLVHPRGERGSDPDGSGRPRLRRLEAGPMSGRWARRGRPPCIPTPAARGRR